MLNENKFRILSIDGGGIRGVIPATILIEVEKLIQLKTGDNSKKIGDYFDLIAGTSTGGILTCIYLAPDGQNAKAKFSAQDALDLYVKNGDEIFNRSVFQRIVSLNGLSDEKYDTEPLENILKKYFGALQLKNLIKPCLITAYATKSYQPFFFTQHDAKLKGAENFSLCDVARATSAAPTYFQAAMPESLDDVTNAEPMIDGGVFANNPTACALIEAIKSTHTELKNYTKIEDFAVLSLGTGHVSKSISFGECKNWGTVDWVKPLIDLLMDASSQTIHKQMETLFQSVGAKNQYLRIDGKFDDIDRKPNDAMDDASKENLKLLMNFGNEIYQRNQTEIQNFIKNN